MIKIAICPGHTESAKGAINKRHGLNEHDEAWQVCLAMADVLKVNGYDVHLISGKLSEKVARINAGSFDLALDIHFNADDDHLDPDDFDDSRGHGCMVMYCPGSDMRKEQAGIMSKRMAQFLGNGDLGGREGWYWGGSHPGTIKDYFIRSTNCPAFIPECGYIDNNGFAEKWLVPNHHADLAAAIASGIMAINKQ